MNRFFTIAVISSGDFKKVVSIVLLLLLFVPSLVFAQKSARLTGVVKDSKGAAVELATVTLNSAMVAVTDKKGNFKFENVPAGTYTYSVVALGYASATSVVNVSGDAVLNVTLRPLNLSLNQVVVTATQAKMGSKSVIGQDAIRHIQPKGLGDLLQLLPGNLTQNPTLNDLSQAQIREIGANNNNALGTVVIVDGVPLSNDGNMQQMSSAKFGNSISEGGTDQTTAGKGVDLRVESADNIESVEVIRGIAPVDYGNLTSGVVIVKTKSGETPWELKGKVDPFSKMAYVGKGLALNGGGAINFGVDYSQSYDDVRRHYLGYERVTTQLGYSNVFGKWTFNVKGAFHSNVNERRHDRQQEDMGSLWKNVNQGFRVGINGKWNADLNWITALTYSVSAQGTWTRDTYKTKVNTPDGNVSTSRVEGINPSRMLDTAYVTSHKILGNPLNFYAQVKANKYLKLGGQNNRTNVRVGLDYSYDVNNGDGMSYNEKYPPQSMETQTLRPRPFNDVPAIQTLAGFIDNRLNVAPMGRPFELYTGLRLSNMFLNKKKSGGHNDIFVLEPRANFALTLLDKNNNSIFDELSINGGYGLSNKMPTLSYLYPDYAYYDNVSLSHAATRTSLMTTKIIKDTYNADLKPARSTKWEVGLNFRIGQVKGNVTYFNEIHRNEYGFKSQWFAMDYTSFLVPTSGVSNVTFNGTDVFYNTATESNVVAGKQINYEFLTWAKPYNTTRSDKQGIEYTLTFPEWKALRTSLTINGAWFHIDRRSDTPESFSIVTNNQNKTSANYKSYVGIYSGYSGSVQDRVNTNFLFITHIPAVNLIFTTTMQVVWYQSNRVSYTDGKGHDLYSEYKDPVTGKNYLAIYPQGYYTHDKNTGVNTYHEWTPEDANDAIKFYMVERNSDYYYNRDIVKPWVMFNFRLTKELGKVAELSFIANNLLNMRKTHVNKYSYARSQIYPDAYFGAELKFKF